jgi:hypothetical protein
MLLREYRKETLDKTKYKVRKQWNYYKKYNRWKRNIIRNHNDIEKMLLQYYNKNNYKSSNKLKTEKLPVLFDDSWKDIENINISLKGNKEDSNIEKEGFEKIIIDQISSNCQRKKDIDNYNPLKKTENKTVLQLRDISSNSLEVIESNINSPVSYSKRIYYELLNQLYMRNYPHSNKSYPIQNVYYRDGRLNNIKNIYNNIYDNSKIKVSCYTKIVKGDDCIVPIGTLSSKKLDYSYWDVCVPDFNLKKPDWKSEVKENVYEEILKPNSIKAKVEDPKFRGLSVESTTGDIIISTSIRVLADRIPKVLDENWKYESIKRLDNNKMSSIIPYSLFTIDRSIN